MANKIMTSGRDASLTIYCEPSFTFSSLYVANDSVDEQCNIGLMMEVLSFLHYSLNNFWRYTGGTGSMFPPKMLSLILSVPLKTYVIIV